MNIHKQLNKACLGVHVCSTSMTHKMIQCWLTRVQQESQVRPRWNRKWLRRLDSEWSCGMRSQTCWSFQSLSLFYIFDAVCMSFISRHFPIKGFSIWDQNRKLPCSHSLLASAGHMIIKGNLFEKLPSYGVLTPPHLTTSLTPHSTHHSHHLSLTPHFSLRAPFCDVAMSLLATGAAYHLVMLPCHFSSQAQHLVMLGCLRQAQDDH